MENEDSELLGLEVSEDAVNQLYTVHYFSKNKEKALYMLTASKELQSIQKKMKTSFISYNPFDGEEEIKSIMVFWIDQQFLTRFWTRSSSNLGYFN